MTLTDRLDHRLAVTSLTITSTYYAEVWSDMDTWLGKHCRGAFHLVSPCEGWFEFAEDLIDWQHTWHRGATVLRRTTE